MRDLFFEMYGTGIEWTIWCLLFLLIGIILLIVSLIKLKKKAKIAGIIVSALLIWQIVPVGFYWMAWFSSVKTPVNELIASGGEMPIKYIPSPNNFVKYMEIAVNTSVIPWQKGIYYCEIAYEYGAFKQGHNAIKAYDKAYRYIKSYKYDNCWRLAPFVYELSGDYKKALKIADESKRQFQFYVSCLISNNEYDKALILLNKMLEFQADNMFYAYVYANRAYVNYALGNKDAELADYQKALSLAKDEKQKKYVMEYRQIRDKELTRKKQAAINMGFVKE